MWPFLVCKMPRRDVNKVISTSFSRTFYTSDFIRASSIASLAAWCFRKAELFIGYNGIRRGIIQAPNSPTRDTKADTLKLNDRTTSQENACLSLWIYSLPFVDLICPAIKFPVSRATIYIHIHIHLSCISNWTYAARSRCSIIGKAIFRLLLSFAALPAASGFVFVSNCESLDVNEVIGRTC